MTSAGGADPDLPASFLAFSTRSDSWAQWLAELPRLIRGVLSDWSLTPDGEIRSGQAAVALPVRTATG